ncbi:MAG: hypothetical protein DRQ88_03160 [Epsilonproteobacteria bacterium]|nr:MAG: hypothetical protein DRQ89_01600 [Campylobacterota bacterium]RLA67319.1 MAG: hypothetical protein DRQ88_03160 [Campylobacterota bacterium]
MKYFIGLVLFFIMMNGFALDPVWEEISNKDGIKVYTASVPGTTVKGFKGETIMNDSIEKILYVIMDDEHRSKWVKRLKVSKMLEEISDYEAIMYQEIELPWPLKNRDFVFWGKIERPEKGKVILKMKSVKHKDAPKTVGIRGELLLSKYVLTSLGKSKTKIEVEILTDPKGLIPKWLVNMIQAQWPYKTFKAIGRQLKKDYTKEYSLPPFK